MEPEWQYSADLNVIVSILLIFSSFTLIPGIWGLFESQPTIIVFNVPFIFQILQFTSKIPVFGYFVAFFHFHCDPLKQQNPQHQKLCFWLNNTRSGLLANIIIISFEIFTPIFTNSLSRESAWEHFYSSLQDSSEYPCWSIHALNWMVLILTLNQGA